jgi:sugar O-acyltransferase (sialic acid O-acetyltransferase NeuD family)
MFGCNALFNDMYDLVEKNNGIITKVVLNMEIENKPKRITFQERMLRTPSVQLVRFDEFIQNTYERYIIGFPGLGIEKLVNEVKEKFKINFQTLTHPSTIYTRHTIVGEGSIILAGVIIASYVSIGKFVRINRGATIGHDTVLEDFSSVQPGANIASNVRVGKGAKICLGANIAEDLVIGAGSTVAAGAVVLEDVPDNCMVAGVPAVIKKKI